MAFIGTLCLILVATTLGGHFAKRFGAPAVIGQLLAGVILGKSVFDLIEPSDLITHFSEIGVILLMFLAGLESEFSLRKKYMKPSILVAILGVIFPVLLGFGNSKFFHIANNEAIFFGILFAATSVSISVEVLKELHILSSKEGTTVLGASVVDDILVVLVLSLSLSFLTDQTGNQVTSLPRLLGGQVLYFIVIFFLIRRGVSFLLRLSQKIYAESAVIIVSLVICLSMSYLAEFVGLSSVIGAFFSGIAVGQTRAKEKVQQSIKSIGYAVFIPVFFVNIGLEVQLKDFLSQSGFILLFVVTAVLSKLLGGFLGSKFSGFSGKSALMVGAGMVSRGEMALIILQIGQQTHLIADQYYSPLVIIILLTTLISPILMKIFAKQLYKKAKEPVNTNMAK